MSWYHVSEVIIILHQCIIYTFAIVMQHYEFILCACVVPVSCMHNSCRLLISLLLFVQIVKETRAWIRWQDECRGLWRDRHWCRDRGQLICLPPGKKWTEGTSLGAGINLFVSFPRLKVKHQGSPNIGWEDRVHNPLALLTPVPTVALI